MPKQLFFTKVHKFSSKFSWSSNSFLELGSQDPPLFAGLLYSMNCNHLIGLPRGVSTNSSLMILIRLLAAHVSSDHHASPDTSALLVKPLPGLVAFLVYGGHPWVCPLVVSCSPWYSSVVLSFVHCPIHVAPLASPRWLCARLGKGCYHTAD